MLRIAKKIRVPLITDEVKLGTLVTEKRLPNKIENTYYIDIYIEKIYQI